MQKELLDRIRASSGNTLREVQKKISSLTPLLYIPIIGVLILYVVVYD
jgi:hypothetical protein